MNLPGDSAKLAKVLAERDLYLRLLELGQQEELEPFLREALALMVEVTGAHQGYLELYEDDEQDEPHRWSMAHAPSAEELSGVRVVISRGIIAEAVAPGQTIVTPSALLDPRFNHRESVHSGHI